METHEIRECMQQLAKYEDTGLEPEEVQAFICDKTKEQLENGHRYYNLMERMGSFNNVVEELERYKQAEEERENTNRTKINSLSNLELARWIFEDVPNISREYIHSINGLAEWLGRKLGEDNEIN